MIEQRTAPGIGGLNLVAQLQPKAREMPHAPLVATGADPQVLAAHRAGSRPDEVDADRFASFAWTPARGPARQPGPAPSHRPLTRTRKNPTRGSAADPPTTRPARRPSLRPRAAPHSSRAAIFGS